MSRLAYRQSALDAAVAAAATTAPRMDAWRREAGATTTVSAADGASVAMLWRIRRRIGEGAMPLLQFVPCDAHAGAGRVAAGCARAAAAMLGRTLLIDARRAATADAVPDAYVSRLYHQCLAGPALCSLISQSIETGGRPGGTFSAIMIDQISPMAGDAACAMAPLCRGSVLVVRAGVTRLHDIRVVAQRLQAVGGLVLGTVLVDAPLPAAVA